MSKPCMNCRKPISFTTLEVNCKVCSKPGCEICFPYHSMFTEKEWRKWNHQKYGLLEGMKIEMEDKFFCSVDCAAFAFEKFLECYFKPGEKIHMDIENNLGVDSQNEPSNNDEFCQFYIGLKPTLMNTYITKYSWKTLSGSDNLQIPENVQLFAKLKSTASNKGLIVIEGKSST